MVLRILLFGSFSSFSFVGLDRVFVFMGGVLGFRKGKR